MTIFQAGISGQNLKRGNSVGTGIYNVFEALQQVAFIQYDDQLLGTEIDSRDYIAELFGKSPDRGVDIENCDDAVGHHQLFECPLDADCLDRVGGFADAGSVDETEGGAVDVEDFLDGVTGSAGDRGDYRPILAKQRVEQGALAGIGGTHYRNWNTSADGVAQTEGIRQLFQLQKGGIQQGYQLVTVGEFNLVFTEVQLQLH